MRCQKVRSCLSAYCREELIGREVLAVREHLATCDSCRKEEASLRTLFTGAQELSPVAASADFNTRLLNRLAQERFAETRTKAYMPRRATRFVWRQVAPVLAGALVLAVVAVGTFTPRQDSLVNLGSSKQHDDSYMTVQPTGNPNMTGNLTKNWSLRSQLAQAERLSRISGMLTSSRFNSVGSTSHLWGDQVSSSRDMLKFRPVIRIYQPANSTQATEARAIY